MDLKAYSYGGQRSHSTNITKGIEKFKEKHNSNQCHIHYFVKIFYEYRDKQTKTYTRSHFYINEMGVPVTYWLEHCTANLLCDPNPVIPVFVGYVPLAIYRSCD